MKWAPCLYLLLLLTSCRHHDDHRIVFILKGAFNRHFLIERAGRVGERPVIVDSGVGRTQRLPPLGERFASLHGLLGAVSAAHADQRTQ